MGNHRFLTVAVTTLTGKRGVLRQWRGARGSNGKKSDRLDGAGVIGERQARQQEYCEETEDEDGDGEIELRSGWTGRTEPQHQRDANQSDKCATDPEFPHV